MQSNEVVLRSFEQQAIFRPDQGMALTSFTKNHIEALDPQSRQDFDHYRAGLGTLIGPHFYLQKEKWIVPIEDPSLFPHLQYTNSLGFRDPFSHGLGRYAPWSYTATSDSISSHLSGRDVWQGKQCMEWEGVDFDMQMDAKLTSTGLHFSMSVSSPRECVIGLHYYYNLILENACITSEVQDQYNDLGIFKPLPEKWMKNDRLHLELNEAADFGFLPLDGSSGEVILLMSRYKLRIAYQGRQNEVSWQLYHPKGSSFVCIEPMSVKNPRRLSSCKSSLNVEIEILPH